MTCLKARGQLMARLRLDPRCGSPELVHLSWRLEAQGPRAGVGARVRPVAQRTRPGSSEPEDTWKMSRRIKTVSGGSIQELCPLFFIACGIDQSFHINRLYIYNQTK